VATVLSTPLERVRTAFQERFGATPDLVVRAPGRVNLIGEHTDYNEGFVFPVAIDREVVLAARRRTDGLVSVWSCDYRQEDRFALGAISRLDSEPDAPVWGNYLRGVVSVVQAAGCELGGFEAVLAGNVPQGSGLSSSAALEVATATLLDRLFDLRLDGRRIALLAQQAENQFVGVQCGIMDQFISALGREGHALMIDCRSLDYQAVPLHLERAGAAIVILDSGVRRGLVDSEFNARRLECREAVEALRTALGRPSLTSLRDVTAAELHSVAGDLPPVLRARARHVVTENERVTRGMEALQAGDVAAFGQLMNQSHDSLRSDYRVSTDELDRLVSLTQALPGVYGARLTGAGFGGCTVSLVAKRALPLFDERVLAPYRELTGRSATMFVCSAVKGAGVVG